MLFILCPPRDLINLFISVPIIAVFTKYDQLIDRTEFELLRKGIEGVNREDLLKTAKEELQKLCIKPFEAVAGDRFPHITVSSKPKI